MNIDASILIEQKARVAFSKQVGHMAYVFPIIEQSDDFVQGLKCCIWGIRECLKSIHSMFNILTENAFSEKAFVEIKTKSNEIWNALDALNYRYIEILKKKRQVMTVVQQRNLELEFLSFFKELDEEIEQTKAIVRDMIRRAKTSGAEKEPGYISLKPFFRKILSISSEEIVDNFRKNNDISEIIPFPED